MKPRWEQNEPQDLAQAIRMLEAANRHNQGLEALLEIKDEVLGSLNGDDTVTLKWGPLQMYFLQLMNFRDLAEKLSKDNQLPEVDRQKLIAYYVHDFRNIFWKLWGVNDLIQHHIEEAKTADEQEKRGEDQERDAFHS